MRSWRFPGGVSGLPPVLATVSSSSASYASLLGLFWRRGRFARRERLCQSRSPLATEGSNGPETVSPQQGVGAKAAVLPARGSVAESKPAGPRLSLAGLAHEEGPRRPVQGRGAVNAPPKPRCP